MTGTPVRVLLSRHGETAWNVEGRWQGQSDSPLTERGRQQAHVLAEALSDVPLAAVFSSDLGRARQTAAIIAERHHLPVTEDARLREIDCGAWTGMLGADLTSVCPEQVAAWRDRPWTVRLPEGESLAEVRARCQAFFDEMMPRHVGQVVSVVTHGATAQCVLSLAMGRPVEALWLKEGRLENCQISRLTWTAAEGLQLEEYADVRHLVSVGSLQGWRVMDEAPRVSVDDPLR
ncbi:MAG: histidine phosphatase family protein [Chloroflexi bacterium]|nr:histidine phosphatase family protein [Chloroflexota bacterium]